MRMGTTIAPPVGSVRTGAGQSSFRLASVQVIGAGVALGTGVGDANMLGLGDVASGDVVATATTDGAVTGGTTDGSRRMPEPAAKAPPTSNRAAAARSVTPRPRPNLLARRDDAQGRRVA